MVTTLLLLLLLLGARTESIF